MSKKHIFIAGVIVILCGGCNVNSDKMLLTSIPTQQEIDKKNEVIANDLAQKYGAITNWEDEVNYTVELQERLINEKPVLFKDFSIDDVFMHEGKYFVRFTDYSIPPYSLDLEIDKTFLDKNLTIMNDNTSFDIIAKVTEVSRPALTLQTSNPNGDEANSSIEMDSLSLFRPFFINGVLIDFALMPSRISQ